MRVLLAIVFAVFVQGCTNMTVATAAGKYSNQGGRFLQAVIPQTNWVFSEFQYPNSALCTSELETTRSQNTAPDSDIICSMTSRANELPFNGKVLFVVSGFEVPVLTRTHEGCIEMSKAINVKAGSMKMTCSEPRSEGQAAVTTLERAVPEITSKEKRFGQMRMNGLLVFEIEYPNSATCTRETAGQSICVDASEIDELPVLGLLKDLVLGVTYPMRIRTAQMCEVIANGSDSRVQFSCPE